MIPRKPQLGMHRTFNPENLKDFVPANHAPNAWKAHQGACKDCGQPTERSVTVGPPGHPENGWHCPACSEQELRRQFASSQVDRFLRKP